MAAPRAGMMPARMVSRVASATRKRAASTGREATRVEVPETFWMMMFPGMSSISLSSDGSRALSDEPDHAVTCG